jgi:hypothetical protein
MYCVEHARCIRIAPEHETGIGELNAVQGCSILPEELRGRFHVA